MIGRHFLCTVFGTLLVVLAGTAIAPQAHAGPPTTHDQALALFDQGRAAYREGRFQESVDLLNKAYELEKEPVLLYNLARGYEGLGDFERAVATYEQYLRDGRDISDRPAIEARIVTMKKTIDDKARLAKERDDALKAKAQGDKGPAAESRPARSPSPAPWIVAGVGVLGLGAGAALGVVALAKHDDADAAASQADAFDQQESANSLALGATIAFITGGVILGGGVVWGIVDVTVLSDDGSPPAEVKVTAGPASAELTVRF